MTIGKPSFFKSFYPYSYVFSRFDRETQFSKGFPVDQELIHPGKKTGKQFQQFPNSENRCTSSTDKARNMAAMKVEKGTCQKSIQGHHLNATGGIFGIRINMLYNIYI